MKQLLLTVLLFPFLASVAGASSPLILASEGQSDYDIVVSPDAVETEKTAAKEFRSYFNRITGIELTSGGGENKEKKQILIGQSEQIRALLPDVDFSTLKADEIIIRTVKDSLVISGGRPRGTLYAVYTFLEDQLGIRWWTSADTFIPRKTNIFLSAINIRYAPKLETREIFYRDIIRNPEFAVRLKNNGHHVRAGENLGGNTEIIGFVHTFNQFLPAEKYFERHPEWFSLENGKRVGGQSKGQLCLSNDEMRKEFTRIVVEKLRKSSSPRIISVSQNDNSNYCRCPHCKAVDDAEGGPAGSLIRFVNLVAADVEREFPAVKVETLAYTYTRKPPTRLRPRHNVIIRLCSIECDFSKPLSAEANRGFGDDVKKWVEISPALAIWNYGANFLQYIQPHPNMDNFAANILFFVNNRTVALFEQGDSSSGDQVGDFVGLRAWVLSKLAWNPSLDQKKLTGEFMHGYYGAAAPYLLDYLKLMEDAMHSSGARLSCYEPDTAQWLSLEHLNAATKIFNQAEMVAKDNIVLREKVKRARISLDCVWAWRGKQLRQIAAKSGHEYGGPSDPDSFCGQFIKDAQTLKVIDYAEHKPLSVYVALLEKHNATRAKSELPKALEWAKNKEWHEFQQDRFNIYKAGELSFVEPDPEASNGQAVRLPGYHKEWAIQCITGDIVQSKSWRIFMAARCKGGNATAKAAQVGIYDPSAKRTHVARDLSIGELSSQQYQIIDIGTFKLNSGMFFWVCPGNNPDVENVWVDRFIIVAE